MPETAPAPVPVTRVELLNTFFAWLDSATPAGLVVIRDCLNAGFDKLSAAGHFGPGGKYDPRAAVAPQRPPRRQ